MERPRSPDSVRFLKDFDLSPFDSSRKSGKSGESEVPTSSDITCYTNVAESVRYHEFGFRLWGSLSLNSGTLMPSLPRRTYVLAFGFPSMLIVLLDCFAQLATNTKSL